ncbi:hypothetical protein M2280_001066 [Prescottella agglutinans]|uniref:Uncharacterized protein n=1 Tax=Prescottella agglutinans TaxID=1644129 RepID=A0ABT6M6B7_9NOCA|nr:hypothetical protein [Prescottella agglutinans]
MDTTLRSAAIPNWDQMNGEHPAGAAFIQLK